MDKDHPDAKILHLLQGGVSKDQAEVEKGLKVLRELLADPAFLERFNLFARISFTKFTALQRAGYTPQEALYLIGISPVLI